MATMSRIDFGNVAELGEDDEAVAWNTACACGYNHQEVRKVVVFVIVLCAKNNYRRTTVRSVPSFCKCNASENVVSACDACELRRVRVYCVMYLITKVAV